MICIECGLPVSDTYKEFSKGNIRLTYCSRCELPVDKYVEYEFTLVVLDLVLHRAAAYRHFLFNRLPYKETGIHGSVFLFSCLLIIFDTYYKWIRGLSWGVLPEFDQVVSLLTDTSAISHITLIASGFITFYGSHFLVIPLTFLYIRWSLQSQNPNPLANSESSGHFVMIKWNYLLLSLIISSFGRLFFALMLIWEFSSLHVCAVVLFVYSSNAIAMSVFLDVHPFKVAPICIVLLFARLCLSLLVQSASPFPVEFVCPTGTRFWCWHQSQSWWDIVLHSV